LSLLTKRCPKEGGYGFGETPEDARLMQTFFFQLERKATNSQLGLFYASRLGFTGFGDK